jgi:1-acyl-sn-glycerol-3-phosphate acyltransferase
MAQRTGRPIVPIHLEGTRRILAKGSRRIRPGRVQVTFGAPLKPSVDTDPRDLATRLEAAIAALADEVDNDWYTARRRAAAGTTPSLTGPGGPEWRRAWALSRPGRDGRRGTAQGRWPWT